MPPVSTDPVIPAKPRILIVDDNPAIHEDFRKILCPGVQASALDAMEAALFDEAAAPAPVSDFEMDSAFQGQEALSKVQRALEEARPYAMAFVDGRMPPGWDGVETIMHLWKAYPDLQVVICTAYSDYSWEQIIAKVGQSDSLVILKKPFDAIEAVQLAHAMTTKWALNLRARAKAETLEAMVRERTLALEETNRTLVAAKEAAEAGNRAKSDFLATMSHEIRTPLNGVIGMTSLLLDTQLDPEQRDCAQTIKFSGETLLTLLSDILDLSQIEAGKFVVECHELMPDEVVGEALRIVEATAAKKGLTLRYEPLPNPDTVVLGDATRLRQIVLNLVSNAIKFTDKGEVHVTVTAEPLPDDRIELSFSVTDTGIGINEADRARLFAPFMQADSSTTRKYGGTGLGLAISSRLVRLMQGEIGVESEPGRGSTFWFRIPLPSAAKTCAA